MAKADFKWSRSGYTELMNESGIQGMLQKAADSIAKKAESMLSEDWGEPPKSGAHFTVGEWSGTDMHVNARTVRTHTEHAKRSQSKNKTLTKALNSTKV